MARTPRVLPGGQTDERTHVLEVLGNAIVGGMENYVRNLAANLPSNEFKVSLLCPYESPYTALLRSEGLLPPDGESEPDEAAIIVAMHRLLAATASLVSETVSQSP